MYTIAIETGPLPWITTSKSDSFEVDIDIRVEKLKPILPHNTLK